MDQNEKKKSNGDIVDYLSRYWIWILYVIGVCVQVALLFFQANKNYDPMNIAIMIVFFLIILGLFVRVTQCISAGLKFRADIEEATELILSLSKDKDTNVLDVIFVRDMFHTDILANAFRAYKDDTLRMQEINSDAKVDIEDYINQDLIDDAISMHYMEQIPGAMTSLGILGTFVGLSLGLNAFNFEEAGRDLTSQLQPLMDGIKVAFHTSIVGLIYSVGFNLVFRRQLVNERAVLDEFLSTYRKYVVDVTEDGTSGTFIKYQEHMVELLTENAKNQQYITTLLTEQNQNQVLQRENQNSMIELQRSMVELQKSGNLSIATMQSNMAMEISKMIETTIVPEIQKMTTAVDNFADETHRDQSKELEKIVDRFVMQMDSSLGKSFESLESIVVQTSEWQKDALAEMKHVLEEIEKMGLDLGSVNQDLEASVKKVSDYIEQINALQDTVNANQMSLNVQTDYNNELLAKQSEMLTNISESTDKTSQTMAAFLKEASSQSEELQNTSKQVMEATTECLAAAKTNMEEVKQQTQTSMNAIAESVKDSVSVISEASNTSVKAMTEASTSSVKAMTDVSTASVKAMTDASNTSVEQLKGAIQTETDLMRDAYEKLEARNSESISQITGQLTELTNNVSAQTEKSIQAIAETSSSMETKFEKQITESTAKMSQSAEDISKASMQSIQQLTNALEQEKDVLHKNYEELHALNVNSMSAVAAQIQQMNADLSRQAEDNMKRMNELTDQMNQTMNHQLKEYLDSTLALSELNKNKLESAFNAMEKAMNAKLEQITSANNLISGDISRATAEMTKAANNLDDTLERRLQSVLQSFDEELTRAVSHLSGTITSMDKITQRVPLVVKGTCISLDDKFQEMQTLMDQYLEYADKLHRNLELKWQQWERENK